MPFVLSEVHSLLSPQELEQRRQKGAEDATRWLEEFRKQHAARKREEALAVGKATPPDDNIGNHDPTQARAAGAARTDTAMQPDAGIVDASKGGEQERPMEISSPERESKVVSEGQKRGEGAGGEQQQASETGTVTQEADEDAMDLDNRSQASSTPSQIPAFSPTSRRGAGNVKKCANDGVNAESFPSHERNPSESVETPLARSKHSGTEDRDEDYVDNQSSASSASSEVTAPSEGGREASKPQLAQTHNKSLQTNLGTDEPERQHATSIPPNPYQTQPAVSRNSDEISNERREETDEEAQKLIVALRLPQPFLPSLAKTPPSQAQTAPSPALDKNNSDMPQQQNHRTPQTSGPPPSRPTLQNAPGNAPGDLPTPLSQQAQPTTDDDISRWLSSITQPTPPTTIPPRRRGFCDYDLTSEKSSDSSSNDDVTVTSWRKKHKQVVIDLTDD